MTKTKDNPDLVLLVPGIFGFGGSGAFYYFGDRISAWLSGYLEGELGYAVPVVPLTLEPAGSLPKRQRHLLDAIEGLLEHHEGVARVHLVGSCVGGVDAELLLGSTMLDGEPWSDAHQRIRERIASVVTVAAPHYGTTLAMSDVARVIERPWSSFSRLGALLPPAFAIAATLPSRVRERTQLLGAVGARRSLLRQLWSSRSLLSELSAPRMEALRSRTVRALMHVPVTCYVACGLGNPSPARAGKDRPDALFMYLTNHTAGARVDRVSADVLANVRALNGDGVDVILSPSSPPRSRHVYDAIDNDGVVNTARQLLPLSALGAIVHADHADMLGHYDRRDPLRADRFVRQGAFRSGARFGDDEFFGLYRSIGRDLLAAARTSLRRGQPARAPGAADTSISPTHV